MRGMSVKLLGLPTEPGKQPFSFGPGLPPGLLHSWNGYNRWCAIVCSYWLLKADMHISSQLHIQ